MEKLNYRQAYDLIIDAYFKDEIYPFDASFCFCGTLNKNKPGWGIGFIENIYYSGEEYFKMERALFNGMNEYFPDATKGKWTLIKHTDIGEEVLFNGMSEALDVLKEIHRNRGEDVDEEIVFRKRKLLPKDRAMSGEEVQEQSGKS